MPFVFDAYGTLFDIESATKTISEESGLDYFKDTWESFSADWREKQLRYTWLYSMMGCYEDFWTLTVKALDSTLCEFNLKDKTELKERLLSLYAVLPLYGEVPDTLESLVGKSEKLAVLSNANSDMLEKALTSANISHYFDDLISVDILKCYKPAPIVYGLVSTKYNCLASDIKFFSSNNWDIAGAKNFGCETVWINRKVGTWDNLPGEPDYIVGSLAEGVQLFST